MRKEDRIKKLMKIFQEAEDSRDVRKFNNEANKAYNDRLASIILDLYETESLITPETVTGKGDQSLGFYEQELEYFKDKELLSRDESILSNRERNYTLTAKFHQIYTSNPE